MIGTRRRALSFALCSLVAAFWPAVAGEAAVAAPAATAPPATVDTVPVVSGTVGINLTGGIKLPFPGVMFRVGSTLDTKIPLTMVQSVTNNTDHVLVVSGDGSARIRVAVGATVTLAKLGSGTLHIAAA